MWNPFSFGKVSESPTHPRQPPKKKKFDVADLYEGPLAAGAAAQAAPAGLDEKLRQAYFWIVNNAIVSPYYDIEYNDEPPQAYVFGDSQARLTLPTEQSYSSFVLLPLLTLLLRRKCLFVGGPGRGKTTSAMLMGLLAGYSLKEMKRAVQHGQPQMTIADLLGNPLPSALVGAKSMDEIQIAWRRWLSMRVKIVDEYNRIPTRTQSALLCVMAENYAEILDQVHECPESAWYLTANDDAGGGTYQVIEALRDRIDVVVQALHFNTRFLRELLVRVEEGIQPERMIPPQVVFAEAELDAAHRAAIEIQWPAPLLRRLEFFASHFEFCEPAGEQIEYRTKDSVRLASLDLSQILSAETGKDKVKDLGSQTMNGLSVRALMTTLAYVKAMAFFRGASEVAFEDLRQILPFVLSDKLVQNPDSPFFEQAGNRLYRTDKVSWLRKLFDLSCAEYDRLDLDRSDPLDPLEAEFAKGLEGLSESDTRARLARIERTLADLGKTRKFYGSQFDDVLKSKYLHQRYTNYLRWLKWKGAPS